jgi:hypothetical protein
VLGQLFSLGSIVLITRFIVFLFLAIFIMFLFQGSLSCSCYGRSLLCFYFKCSSQCSCPWALYCALVLMWGGAIVQHFKVNQLFPNWINIFPPFFFGFVCVCVLCFCFVVIVCGCVVFLQDHVLPSNLKIFCL